MPRASRSESDFVTPGGSSLRFAPHLPRFLHFLRFDTLPLAGQRERIARILLLKRFKRVNVTEIIIMRYRSQAGRSA